MRIINCSKSVKLYEVFETDEKIYLVIELLYGGDLFERIINKGNYSEKEASYLMIQILTAIQSKYIYLGLNEKKVIHRDIKPENLVFRDSNNELLLTDYGLSEFNNDTDQIF